MMKKGRLTRAHLLMHGVAAGALFTGLGVAPALAQDVDPAEEQAVEAREGETIIVRARKRDESIEDVPASVSVLTSDDLERLAVEDVADFTRQTPGAILIGSGPQYLNDIALRGQGGGRLGFSESTTGIYRDGIYVAGGGFGGRSYGRIDFYDVQAIEVYRGPQGALYGRNAVGGAVNVITNKPVLDTQIKAKAGYNNVERLELSSTLNLPLADTIALRVGGYYEDQQGGFYTASNTGETIDWEKNWGVRGAIGVGIGTDSTANLTVEYSENESPGFTVLGQNITLDPDPFIRTNINTVDRVTIDQIQMLFDFTHDFGGSELTILANYKGRQGARAGADFDHYLGLFSPAIDLYDDQSEDFDRFGGEVRWGSTNAGPFTWLVGADFLSYVSEVTSDRYGTVLVPAASAAGRALRAQLRTDVTREELDSFSAFGLIGYDITDRLNFSIEARVQQDSKRFRFERIDMDTTTDEAIPLTFFEREWTRFLPTASLSYEFTESLTGYARLATGYRPGGFNQTPSPGFFDEVPYDPEDVTQAELGLKGLFYPGASTIRAQLAGYYGWTKDVQQVTTVTVTNPAFSLQNVGDNRIYGAEFELSAIVPVGAATFTSALNLSHSRGTWDEGSSIFFQGALLDLSGDPVPRNRDYMLTFNAGMTYPVSDAIDFLFTGSFQTAGGGYDNAALVRTSDGYAVVDLTAGIQGGNWRLLGFVKNLTDDLYRIVEVGGNNYYNTPRTYGVSLAFDW